MRVLEIKRGLKWGMIFIFLLQWCSKEFFFFLPLAFPIFFYFEAGFSISGNKWRSTFGRLLEYNFSPLFLLIVLRIDLPFDVR